MARDGIDAVVGKRRISAGAAASCTRATCSWSTSADGGRTRAVTDGVCVTLARGCRPTDRRWRSSAATRSTTTPTRGCARSMCGPGACAAGARRAARRVRRDRRDRLVAGRRTPGVHGGGRSAAVDRRRTAAGRFDRSRVGQAAVAGRPADRPDRLAVGRERPPRPLVAPVRARPRRRRDAAAGDVRRLGVSAHLAGTRTDGRWRSSPIEVTNRTGVRARDLGGRRRRRSAIAAVAAGLRARRRRWRRSPGVLARRSLDRGRRTARAGAARRLAPGLLLGRADGSRPPVACRRSSTARSATGPTPTSPVGWSPAATGRCGSTSTTIVAVVTDRGRVAAGAVVDRLPVGRSGRRSPSASDRRPARGPTP